MSWPKIENGETLQPDWNMSGRKRYLAVDEIVKYCTSQHFITSKGETVKAETLKQAIIQKQHDEAVAAGIDPHTIQYDEPSEKTLSRALHIANAAVPDAVAVTNTIAKTETRQIAEKSIMSGVVLMLVTLSTHILPCPVGVQPFVCPDNLSPGGKLSIQLMEEYYGGPVIVVHPALVFSTDDMNLFIFKDVLNKNDNKLKLVSAEAYATRGTKSLYDMDNKDDKGLNGVQSEDCYN